VVTRAAQRRSRRIRFGISLAVTSALTLAAVALGTNATALLRSDSRPTPRVVADPIPPLAGNPPTLRMVSAGDSVGLTVAEGLRRVGGLQGDTIMGGAFLGCGLEPAGQTFFRPDRLDVAPDGCPDWQDHWPTIAAEAHANVAVFLGGTWDMFDRYINGQWLDFDTPASDQLLSSLLDTMIDGFARQGTAVALLTMPYQSSIGQEVQVPVYRSSVDIPRVNHWNALLRAAAARHPTEAEVIDLNGFASPGGYTDSLDGVDPFRGDGTHFTDAGADLVATWLLPRLEQVATLAAPIAATAPAPA
jgi:hypothetical protein